MNEYHIHEYHRRPKSGPEWLITLVIITVIIGVLLVVAMAFAWAQQPAPPVSLPPPPAPTQVLPTQTPRIIVVTPTPQPRATSTPRPAATATAVPPPGLATVTPSPVPTPVPDVLNCGGGVAGVYPEAVRDDDVSGEVGALLTAGQAISAERVGWVVGGSEGFEIRQVDIFKTSALVDDILNFFRAELADTDWILAVDWTDFGALEFHCPEIQKRMVVAHFEAADLIPVVTEGTGYMQILLQEESFFEA